MVISKLMCIMSVISVYWPSSFQRSHSSPLVLFSQSCLTLCDPMNRSSPGLPVHHQLPEFTQTHVHWVSDAIQPSWSSPSSPAFTLSMPQRSIIPSRTTSLSITATSPIFNCKNTPPIYSVYINNSPTLCNQKSIYSTTFSPWISSFISNFLSA